MTPYLLRLGAPHRGSEGFDLHGGHAHAVEVVGEETLDIFVLGRLDVAEVVPDPFRVDGVDEGEEGTRCEGVGELHGCRDRVVAEVRDA